MNMREYHVNSRHKLYTIPAGLYKVMSRSDLFSGMMISKLLFLVSRINYFTVKHPMVHNLSQRIGLSNKISRHEDIDLLPPIVVIAPIVSKDFHLISLFLERIRKHSLNEISQIYLVTSKDDFSTLRDLVMGSEKTEVLLEDEVVPTRVISLINQLTGHMKGWVLQMAIKFSVALNSNEEFNLVIDPDTILVSDNMWVTKDLKTAIFPTYHSSKLNSRIYQQFPALNIPSERTECFVSHMMIWRKSIIESMFLSILGSSQSIDFGTDQFKEQALLNLFEFGTEVVDWQLYADYALSNYSDCIARQKWSNLAVYNTMADEPKEWVAKHEGKFLSLSFHTHLLL